MEIKKSTTMVELEGKRRTMEAAGRKVQRSKSDGRVSRIHESSKVSWGTV